jgi:flagellar hook-associated protein 3 FlgL
MRVSGFEKFQMTQTYLNKLQYEQSIKHEQISTGKMFQRVSDDPVRVNKSMLVSSSIARVDQYMSNVSDTKGLLEFIDTTYGNTIDAIHQVKAVAIKGDNDTVSAADRKVMASEVEQMIKQVVSFANSRYLERYTFSGEKTDVKPITYDGATFVYNGNNKEMNIEVSDNLKIKVSQKASDDYVPLLKDLVEIRDALNNNDTTALKVGMGKLDDSFIKMIDKRSEMGVQLKSVEILNEAYYETKVDLTAKKQDVEDVNLADAISEFSYMQTLYQATIKSAASMLKTSIMDYL